MKLNDIFDQQDDQAQFLSNTKHAVEKYQLLNICIMKVLDNVGKHQMFIKEVNAEWLTQY